MAIELLFPSVVHRFDIVSDFGSIKDDFIKYVYQEKRNDPNGVRHTNIGGWQSSPIDLNGNNIIAKLFPQKFSNYFFNTGILKPDVKFRINNAWININGKGHYNEIHYHGNSDISGVFYIKVPINSGGLIFNAASAYARHRENACYTMDFIMEAHTAARKIITPKEGEFILFPSSLYHSVELNKTREDRISVAFNLQLDYPC